jgi:DNA-binding response OmpR family regulator
VHQLGAKDYLVKADFTPDEVLEKARVMLQNHQNSLREQSISAEPQETVPLAASKVLPVVVTSAVPGAQDNLIKVVIVEDDPMLRNMLSVKLSKQIDFASMFISDGSQAVQSIRLFEPQVVVLDLMLPGLNGLEILEQLKTDEALKTLPVIILTNKSDDTDKQRAKELGAAKYLIKAMTDLKDLVMLMRGLAGPK